MSSFPLKAFNLGLICLAVGCASDVTIVREASQASKPRWVDNVVSDESRLYFVGMATDAASLEEGVEAASKAAFSKAADYIGVKISSQFREHATESSTEISSQLNAKSSAGIAGAKIVETYHEKVTRKEGNYIISKFDVYVLTSLDQSFAEKERARQEEENRNKAELANKLFLDAKAKAGIHDYIGAKMALLTAKTNIESMDGNVSLPQGSAIKTSGELQAEIASMIISVTESMRRVSLEVTTNYGDEGDQEFFSNFSMLLAKHGFYITSPQEAQIRIKASTTVYKKGRAMGMESYGASGNAVGISANNNLTVYTLTFESKGFHKNGHLAALNALSEAGIWAGDSFAAGLIKKEEELLLRH